MLKHATQLLVLLLIVSLVSVIVISTILYVYQINSQREQLSIILESISQIGSDNISKWLDERKTNVQNLAEAKLFIDTATNLKNPELSSQEIFQKRLEVEKLSIYVHNSWHWLEGLKISDPNTGETTFEFGDAPTANLKEQQHFIDALNGNIALSEIYSSKEPIINEFEEYEKDVPTLLISAPIYSDVGLEGVLTARVNPFKIDTGVKKYVTDFHSGDAFMVNSDGFLLSRSAFPQDIVNFVERRPELELRVFDPVNQDFTKLFQNADKNKVTTIVDGYNGYRGIPVIGSINPVQDTDWFFIFEIDEAEAYQDFVVIQIIVGYSLAILVIVVFITASHFAKTFSRPIISLKESAEQITSGNLDSPIKTKGSYEISKLSESMEQMRQSVKKSIETEKDLAVAQQQIEMEEKMAKEKEEYAAMITHDLKQPLVPIKGNAALLKDPSMGELNEMQKESVDEIQAGAVHIGNMIETLLTSFKLGAEALEFTIEKLSTKEILDGIMVEQFPVMKPKNIEYVNSSKDDFTISGDKRRVKEVLTNLILNAVDFVPDQGGRIEIGSKDEGKFVQFFVKDNGIGIPKDKQAKLFEKYFQVNTTQSRNYGGTGLGLTICHELVTGMKGKIWLESDEGKGSTFFFTIPKTE